MNPRRHDLDGAETAAVDGVTRRLSTAHAAQALGFALNHRLEETSGASIGHYKLLQKIGEGGFGVVWMAEQEQPIRRRVAVKIIKVGMDTEEVIARFEAERQALALMEHPNIARVLDAGATDAGRPYFVMELVRGVAITRYCDENRLPPAARLRLFIAVCHAVQHAHQKGVIHRDLKPSNILVTLHDGNPVPKIIDFGIAKATSARLTDKTLFTQFHTFIGTPAYTSPEQMEMSGLDVDTRSDIYSLGVLLYELLAGQPPFDSDSLMHSGLEAMRRTIREVDPPPPSRRLVTLPDASRTSVAHHRATDAARLSLLLRGDLDWIALRCLEKDRTRRYDSAASLAADLERHLNDEPVEARPPSRIYRTRKFVRRHRLAVAAGTALALSVIGGLIVSSSLFLRERAAHEDALAAEQKATELRQQAETLRAGEIQRAARTALALANRDLEQGRVADGLAYLVYSARKNPLDPTLAPRLASVMTSHDFLVPVGLPFECGAAVQAIRYSHDGESLLVGTADGTLHILEAASGKQVREIRLRRPTNAFGGWQFATDNPQIFAVRFADETVATFDLASGAQRMTARLDSQLRTDPEVRDNVGLSPDGRWAYARSQQGIWLWDAATGELRLEIAGTGLDSDSDFSADGRRLAFVSGNRLQLWSLPGCTALGDPISIGPRVSSNQRPTFVRFSPDGQRIVVSEFGLAIHVLDARTGAPLRAPILHGEVVFGSAMVFSPDGRLLLVSENRGGMLDLDTAEFHRLPFTWEGYFSTQMFDRTGGLLLTKNSEGAARLWDVHRGAPAAEASALHRADFQAALSSDGAQIAIGTMAGSVQRLRVARNTARPLVLPRTSPPMPAAFLPDPPARLLWLEGERARVLDVARAWEVPGAFTFPEPVTTPLAGATKSPVRDDAKFMIVRDRRSGWQAWELSDGAIAHAAPLRDNPPASGSVTFSPTRDLIAISSGATVRVWDLRTGRAAGPVITCAHSISVSSVNFSPDSHRLAFGGAGGEAAVWDFERGEIVVRLGPLPEVSINAVRFSPDGTRLLTLDRSGGARLWDAATGAPLGPVLHHNDAGQVAFFSPDGSCFTTITATEVRIWDTATLTLLATPSCKPRFSCFSRDSRSLFIAGDDGISRLWDVRSGQPLTEPMRHGNVRLPAAALNADTRFARTETTGLDYCVWSLPPRLPAGEPAPEWLLQLATGLSSKVVNDSGELVDIADAAFRLDAVRRSLADVPASAPLAEWGRWILDDRADRPIAPGFTATPAEAGQLAALLAQPAGATGRLSNPTAP